MGPFVVLNGAGWDENLGFDKIAGSDFEQRREAALARRAECRMPGVILARHTKPCRESGKTRLYGFKNSNPAPLWRGFCWRLAHG